MKKKKKIRRPAAWIMCLCLAAVFFCLPVRADGERPEESELHAKCAVLMDADSGRVLYEKNGAEQLPMASTTKIMTCILALEEGEPDQRCSVSAKAASMPEVKLGVKEGEEYVLKDLLYALMLESDNDAAVVVAEAVSGSVETFAEEMNQKAWDLGCTQTHFVTPNGLDGADEEGIHSTTAADLARIMRYCIRSEEFREITATRNYTFTDCSGERTFSCTNHNAFLDQMEGSFSGKTGYTGNAGYCYVGALEQDRMTLIVALLACGWPNHKSWKWADTKKLMEYGLAAYEYREFDSASLILPQVAVTGGRDSWVGIRAESAGVRLLLREDEEPVWELRLPESLTAPLPEDTAVGTAALALSGEEWLTVPLYTDRAVVTETTGQRLRRRLANLLSLCYTSGKVLSPARESGLRSLLF